MTTETLPADAIFYLLADIPVVVAPGKPPVALFNKTVSHGAEETFELIERPLTTTEQSQLFALPQLSRDAFDKLTPPLWVKTEAQQKELPRWAAWVKTKAENFKTKMSAPKAKAAPAAAKHADDEDMREHDLSDFPDDDETAKSSYRAVIALAILGLFAAMIYSIIPGCAKKKSGKPAAVAAKSAAKKAAIEDDFMGGRPAPKPIAHAVASSPAGFVDEGKPSCTQTGTGIAWSSNERKLPLVIRSDIAYIASLTSSVNTGYIFVNMRSGSCIVIGTKLNLSLLTADEILSKVPMPSALPSAVKAASVWRFVDSDRGTATRAIELVCNTESTTNPQRVLAQGGIMLWLNNTPTTSAAAFVIGLPNYKAFPCMTDSFARPHAAGESEIRLMNEVKYVGEIATRMVMKDMSLPGKSQR